MSEAQDEQLLDKRVQRRLASDHAYRNAENAEQQAERERAIEDEEIERLAKERVVLDIDPAEEKLARNLYGDDWQQYV